MCNFKHLCVLGKEGTVIVFLSRAARLLGYDNLIVSKFIRVAADWAKAFRRVYNKYRSLITDEASLESVTQNAERLELFLINSNYDNYLYLYFYPANTSSTL